mmetsp:Transcript_20799/g.18949  ORF Transcript_20799/g.18949 Transcript_20799/m.18949 type:complete len:116 (+) Transcript_20799:335-682(+)
MDLSENELAKAHVRHLARGRVITLSGDNYVSSTDFKERLELIYRFEFPESPGALNNYLQTLTQFNQGWNILLFHYRNHGHDFGRVLVALANFCYTGERVKVLKMELNLIENLQDY